MRMWQVQRASVQLFWNLERVPSRVRLPLGLPYLHSAKQCMGVGGGGGGGISAEALVSVPQIRSSWTVGFKVYLSQKKKKIDMWKGHILEVHCTNIQRKRFE